MTTRKRIQKYVIKTPSGFFVTSFQRRCICVSEKVLHGHLYTKEQAEKMFDKLNLKGYTLIEYPVIVL
jgi:hypothetical protein